MKNLVIGIVGNPNSGKTTLFNVLTGTKQHVGNWPGVTVERKVGNYDNIDLVDLPGIYSLDVTEGMTSLDEQIAHDYIISDEADLILNIIDASNLERNLYLTTQLLEMDVPLVVALNMMDIAEERNIKINIETLSQQLRVPVIPITAAKNQGIDKLKQIMNSNIAIPQPQFKYPAVIEEAIDDKSNSRWVNLKTIKNDEQIAEALQEDVDIVIADSRYGFITKVIEKTVKKTGKVTKTISDKIDRIVLNRILGIPIFLAVMYLMFMFTINIGGAFIDFFDMLFGTIFVDGFGAILTAIGLPEAVTILIAGGIGGGIQVVATFIPIIGFLYLFLSFLEDSGYMARAA